MCRAFGIYGYCEAGAGCTERHVAECPDFSNTGKCTTKGCKLLHRERASVLRKANQGQQEGRGGEDGDDDDDDLSSEDGSADSDDVDSDEVDEFLGGGSRDGSEDTDFVAQSDFIAL